MSIGRSEKIEPQGDFPLFLVSFLIQQFNCQPQFQYGNPSDSIPLWVAAREDNTLSSRLTRPNHRPGCLSYGKSNGFPFYNDLQPAETILCFRAKYFGVCAYLPCWHVSNDNVLSLLATIQLNRNPNGFPINGSPAFSKVSS